MLGSKVSIKHLLYTTVENSRCFDNVNAVRALDHFRRRADSRYGVAETQCGAICKQYWMLQALVMDE
ncbi:uncharacterized protein PHALS_11764 [Plasmopara halstedii]|uniref:Uncharacterized protein n=1 Tax=Plasmopara halstedii TaxID=4781 RepID=A0A0P1AKH5_PLAHL|nr:uncharacterized protein PHALS_11764 [Plasmopara halstedii]CEG41415.1 hypothetical protein PHALS_11764 [Plasmopara halstedii]|eukprot:XP_024577784.1 hypothetical protein PHALS_11764 [Plasmopara halstedii]